MFYARVLTALNQANISYAIVGGFAVALHGAVRGTVDLDLVIKLEQKEFLKLESTLNAIGLRSRIPVTAKEVFSFRKEYIEKRNLIAWSFVNPEKASEVVDIILTHDLKKLKTVSVTFTPTLKVKVIDMAGLIAMKKLSGRPQDIEDITALETTKGLRKS